MELIKEIKLDEIVILERLRTLNKEIIKPLSDSIQKNGLLHPIIINQDNVLICGYHRYTACKELNFETILCKIINTPDDDTMKLIEIDENLIRVELHYFDLSEQLKRRKEIYERLYPETTLGGSGKGRKKKQKSFVDDVCEKINKSKSTIYNLLNIPDSLSNEEKSIIKELNISQTDIKLLIEMEENYRKEVLDNMKINNCTLKKSIKYLRNDRNFKKIIRPLNNKFVNHIQVGDTIEIIKNIPDDLKYDCFFIDINNYSENKVEQLKEIDNFLNNVDKLLYDESLLIFFSNEEIDNRLESMLINKFKKVERMITVTEIKKQDSLFDKTNSTVYICRNFTNNEKIYLSRNNYFLSKSLFIGSIIESMKIENMKILDVYTNSFDTLEFSLLKNLNYFGICSSMEKYIQLNKIIDLTQYFNEYFPNYSRLSDKNIHIIKNNIFIKNNEENNQFLINLDDNVNNEFSPIFFNNEKIREISNFINDVENFKILFYEDHINIIIDSKPYRISNISLQNDLHKKLLKMKEFFDIDISNKEKIEFELDDNIDVNEFDMYFHSTKQEYKYYIGNLKSNKNFQIGLRQKL